MPEAFVISKEEEPILLYRPTETRAKLISTERSSAAFDAWSRADIKYGSRVHRAVAEKFKNIAMELIRTGLSYSRYLRAGALTIFSGVRSRQYIEFANSVDSKQVPADAAWSDGKL